MKDVQFPKTFGTRVFVSVASFDAKYQLEAAEKARELDFGVRMEVHNSHTEFYATPDVEVGKIDVWASPKYKGFLEYVETIDAGTGWDAAAFVRSRMGE